MRVNPPPSAELDARGTVSMFGSWRSSLDGQPLSVEVVYMAPTDGIVILSSGVLSGATNQHFQPLRLYTGLCDTGAQPQTFRAGAVLAAMMWSPVAGEWAAVPTSFAMPVAKGQSWMARRERLYDDAAAEIEENLFWLPLGR